MFVAAGQQCNTAVIVGPACHCMAHLYSCNPSIGTIAGHANPADACKSAAYIDKASENGANLSWHQCHCRAACWIRQVSGHTFS